MTLTKTYTTQEIIWFWDKEGLWINTSICPLDQRLPRIIKEFKSSLKMKLCFLFCSTKSLIFILWSLQAHHLLILRMSDNFFLKTGFSLASIWHNVALTLVGFWRHCCNVKTLLCYFLIWSPSKFLTNECWCWTLLHLGREEGHAVWAQAVFKVSIEKAYSVSWKHRVDTPEYRWAQRLCIRNELESSACLISSTLHLLLQATGFLSIFRWQILSQRPGCSFIHLLFRQYKLTSVWVGLILIM